MAQMRIFLLQAAKNDHLFFALGSKIQFWGTLKIPQKIRTLLIQHGVDS